MRKLLFFIAAFVALPAAAQEAPAAGASDEREFCADRPGLGTPPCTTAPGRVMVEVGLADWTLERSATTRTDTILAGDTLLRVGIADHAELQFGWAAFGHVRDRNRSSGAIDTMSGVGDVTLALRRNLANPDGSGASIAIMPYATLPTGGSAIGAGDWGTGVLVPISFDLGAGLSLGLTPEIDAAVDEDGDGRHLAYGSVIGLGVDLSETLSATAEVQLIRDRDPDDRTTQALAGLSAAWQPGEATQFDIGANLGLNRASPDVQLYVGVARRF